jgi:truncated hemoglobin YjbI
MDANEENGKGPAVVGTAMTTPSSIGAECDCLHFGANERRAILLEKLGGPDVLRKAVHLFYEKQLQDPVIRVFFQGADMHIIQWHQFNFMSIAFSRVPQNFDAAHLILTRHKRLFEELGLDESHFDRVVQMHFRSTLEEMHVDEALIQEATAVVAPLRVVFAQGAQAAKEKKARRLQQQRRRQIILVSSLSLIVAAGVLLVLSEKASSRRCKTGRSSS